MPLAAGTRLGPYEVTAQIGAGGMGEVYQATDTKLKRQVRDQGAPGVRRRRCGSAGAVPARSRSAGLAESSPHRDLKPSNVMLTSKGKAKVLDFGLARIIEQEAFQSSISTETTPDETGTGVVVGTAPYMSPEQARGEEVDRKTDVWSFGCVLYEMLSGKRAFPGGTTSDAIAAVLEHEPDWDALPPAAGPIVRSLLRQCLRKDRNRRRHDIADAGLELEDVLSEPALSAGTVAPRAGHYARRWIAYGVAAALLAGMGLWATALRTPKAIHTPTRLNVNIPRADRVGGLELSPDGTRLASGARVDGAWGLYLRQLSGLQATLVPESGSALSPFFSPDGRWLAFGDSSTNTLKKVPVDGGVPITLCDAPLLRGASWGPDGTILFTPATYSGLWRVSAEGGIPVKLTRPSREEGELSHRWPEILPGGRDALFTILALSGRQDESRIALVSLETGERRVLFEGGSFGRYVGTGHIVYGRNGSLLAVPFDLDSLEVTGAAVPVLDDVLMYSLDSGAAQFSISRSGALAYIAESASVPERSLVWVDRQGRTEPVTDERRGFKEARLSPDGGQLAVSVQEGLNYDVWLYDLRRDTKTRLTFGKNNYSVAWTRDGRHVVFSSNREGAFNLFMKPVDGSGSAERLTRSSHWQFPMSVSPDGRFLAYMHIEDNGWDISVLSLEGDREPQLVIGTPFRKLGGAFSPDGDWLAYVSEEPGRREVYVRPFPGPGRRWPISTDGGTEPLWSPDGRELFYREGRKVMVVPVRTQPTFQPGSPRVLFEGRYYWDSYRPPAYDIAPDGQRFVMIQEPEEAAPETQQIVYIPDFFEELKAKMAEAGQ